MHHPTTPRRRRLAVVGLATAAAIALAGCSTGSAPAASETAPAAAGSSTPAEAGQRLAIAYDGGIAVLDAARDISSDGDKSAVLSAVARRYALDGDPVRKAFFGAARTVSSDSDRRGVLQAALARRPLASPVMLDLLGTAEEISSDHDKSSVLLEVVGRPELRDQTVRARFFEVLKTVSSSSDYRRVMEAVVQI